MKLSVVSPVLASIKLADALDLLKGLGVDAIELGCGGYPGTAHADAAELVGDKKKISALKDLFNKKGMDISALAVHSNPVHPDKAFAARANAEFEAACVLAGALGVPRVVTFSGCPGDGQSLSPNWVICPWPGDYARTLEYQWNEELIPYWKKAAKFAAGAGVSHICLEMHPGFCVYTPGTLMRLRNAVGEIICANFDPSHLFWQGIDIVAAIKYLGRAIQYFHAKDTAINKEETSVNGVLDTKSYSDELNRSWIFRTVGYGHGQEEWKNIVSALRMTGYNGYLSIEHEDSLMTPAEGLKKAVAFMKEIIISDDNRTAAWWV